MSCDNCNHRCCVNGESGVSVSGECSKCGNYMQLCSNELTDEQLENRCNGEACGCAEFTDEWICESCKD